MKTNKTVGNPSKKPLEQQSLISISMTKKDYKSNYSLRSRIGITILRIIGVVSLKLK